MSEKHLIVATAGHVDHGKSALVRALTGADPDRLPEEKVRGVTIELGFARLKLPSDKSGAAGLELGLVDVPGHEDFIKNMVAGVGAVDLALFAVAADDGWMPQTEEHLQILEYLGVRQAVVALTKTDLIESCSAVSAAIRARLRETAFANAPIIPTSTISGAGLDDLRRALREAAEQIEPSRDYGKFRLPIDRVFILRGKGTVVTGTLLGGTLAAGAAVVAQPSGRTARVRSLQNHGAPTETARPGMRTACNLPELSATGDQAIARGEILTDPSLGQPGRILDVALHRSVRASGLLKIRPGLRVSIHHGSAQTLARLRLLEGTGLAPASQVLAQLRCETPLFAFSGDRFVVRDAAAQRTIAGGVVLDPDGNVRKFRQPAQVRFLQRLIADPSAASLITALLERDHAVPVSSLARKSIFSDDDISTALQALAGSGIATLLAPGLSADCAWWDGICQSAMAFIDAEHREHPERIGVTLARLRSSARPFLADALFAGLVGALEKNGRFVVARDTIRRASHRPSLPPTLQADGERIRSALAAQPLEPPSVKELAPDAIARQSLRFLRETGEIVELSPDVVVASESYTRMRAAVTRFIRAAGPATTSELRQMLGTTRRVVIPLLEQLDREGVTRRDGDRRALRI